MVAGSRVAPTLLQIRWELQPAPSPLAPNLPSSRGVCKPGAGKHSLRARRLQTPLRQPNPTAAPALFPPKNSPPHVIPPEFWGSSLGESQRCCPRLSLRLQKPPCPSPSSLPAITTKMSQPRPCAPRGAPAAPLLLPMPRGGVRRCPDRVPPWPC